MLGSMGVSMGHVNNGGASSIVYSRFFSSLTPPDSLLKAGTKRFVPQGEYVECRNGQGGMHCYCVLSGLVSIRGSFEDGHEVREHFLEPGSLFNEAPLIDDVKIAEPQIDLRYRAEADSEILCVSKEKFLDIFHEDIDVACYVARSLAQKYAACDFVLAECTSRGTLWRTANIFKVFAARYGVKDGDRVLIDFDMSQQMVGDMLGTSRISIAKCFKQLKDADILGTVDGRYCIKDMNELERFLEIAG